MDVYKFLPNVLSFLGHPAFSGGAIVVGLVLLWLFAKNSEKVSGGVLVHPTTELPLIHPVFPAFRRAVWTCVVASVIAIGICLFYKTSVHLYVMLDSFPLPTPWHHPVPDMATRKSPPYNDAYLQIIHDRKKLEGQALIVDPKNPKAINIDFQLYNSGATATSLPPTARLYLSVPCSMGPLWQAVASDELAYPSEFYMGTIVGGPSNGPVTIMGSPINAHETWSWPTFYCSTSQDIADPISAMLKVFYGSPNPSVAHFIIRKAMPIS